MNTVMLVALFFAFVLVVWTFSRHGQMVASDKAITSDELSYMGCLAFLLVVTSLAFVVIMLAD